MTHSTSTPEPTLSTSDIAPYFGGRSDLAKYAIPSFGPFSAEQVADFILCGVEQGIGYWSIVHEENFGLYEPEAFYQHVRDAAISADPVDIPTRPQVMSLRRAELMWLFRNAYKTAEWSVAPCIAGGSIRIVECLERPEKRAGVEVNQIDHLLTPAKLNMAIGLLIRHFPKRIGNLLNPLGWDREDADVLMQCALFGRVKYG